MLHRTYPVSYIAAGLGKVLLCTLGSKCQSSNRRFMFALGLSTGTSNRLIY